MSAVEAPSQFGIQQYQETWAASTCEVLAQIAGAPFTSQSSKGEAARPGAESVSACFSVHGPHSGEQILSVSAGEGLGLSQLMMGEPWDQTVAFDDSHRDAMTELFRQIAGAAAVSLGASLGSEIQVKFVGTEQPAWTQSTASLRLQLSSSRTPPMTLYLQLSPELSTALQSMTLTERTKEAAKAPTATTYSHETNIDLLKGIELNVTLRFGERQLLLRDVLELVPGSVVELDQQIQEPVELLVGKKVIARGEVVVVDGNYGFRVTEILSAVERIEFLRN